MHQLRTPKYGNFTQLIYSHNSKSQQRLMSNISNIKYQLSSPGCDATITVHRQHCSSPFIQLQFSNKVFIIEVNARSDILNSSASGFLAEAVDALFTAVMHF